jgi:hypothetical protein
MDSVTGDRLLRRGRVNAPHASVGASRRRRYQEALSGAFQSGVPFLIGGGYALEYYTGVTRPVPKDLDLFVRAPDVPTLLGVLRASGFETEITFPHWLAKIHAGRDCIDVIFSSGNGLVEVDDGWFAHGVPATVLGSPVHLCPPEETIWSKAFIMERERYDGADIAHLIRACHARLDWQRLLARFGAHWRVLLGHLALFGYIYPGERHAVPSWVMLTLTDRLAAESREPAPPDHLCRGTLLSRGQYLTDITRWGYADARLRPYGAMTPEDVARWTRAIGDDEEFDHAHCRRR